MRTMRLRQTKLQRPRVPRPSVPRPRLFERLDQGSQAPLTLVCAAAGYGKTTAASSWLERLAAGNASTTQQPVAWISLDEGDSDLGLFLRYFIASLRTMFADARAATASLLQAARRPGNSPEEGGRTTEQGGQTDTCR
jgi:LuxR family maltose regulon positive regulatory protein